MDVKDDVTCPCSSVATWVFECCVVNKESMSTDEGCHCFAIAVSLPISYDLIHLPSPVSRSYLLVFPIWNWRLHTQIPSIWLTCYWLSSVHCRMTQVGKGLLEVCQKLGNVHLWCSTWWYCSCALVWHTMDTMCTNFSILLSLTFHNVYFRTNKDIYIVLPLRNWVCCNPVTNISQAEDMVQ